VPTDLKAEVQARADHLVETELKPRHIHPPREEEPFNYIIDLSTKWYRSFFYFCATYRCPGPNALSPFFEVRFARLEYRGNRRFALAYLRHTGQWWELYPDLSLDECLAAIRDEPHYLP
jgi:hypothetical protein